MNLMIFVSKCTESVSKWILRYKSARLIRSIEKDLHSFKTIWNVKFQKIFQYWLKRRRMKKSDLPICLNVNVLNVIWNSLHSGESKKNFFNYRKWWFNAMFPIFLAKEILQLSCNSWLLFMQNVLSNMKYSSLTHFMQCDWLWWKMMQ